METLELSEQDELKAWKEYHHWFKKQVKAAIKKPGWARRIAPKLMALLKASTVAVVLLSSCQQMPAWAEVIGTASWYSRESCLREGTSGVMANGEVFDDKEMVCASWDYPFETKLKVTNLANKKSVVVTVQDRGPARRLYKKGRIIDLSKLAFSKLDKLEKGVIRVKVDLIKGGDLIETH